MVGFLCLPRLAAEMEAQDRDLAGTPVVVHRQGRILSLTAEAEGELITPGMKLTQARALCPTVEAFPFVEGRYEALWHRALRACIAHVSMVEPAGLGEAFLDLAGPVTPAVALREIAEDVRQATECSVEMGAGPSKLIAKIVSRKAPGEAISADGAARFLKPLAVKWLWPLDDRVLEHLQALGLSRVGDLQRVPHLRLAEHFGVEARRIAQLARGIDDSPVQPLYPPRSISVREFFPGGLVDAETVFLSLRRLADTLAETLRDRQEVCQRVRLRVELAEGGERSRTHPLRAPIGREEDLFSTFRWLWSRLEPAAPVELLEIEVGDLQRTIHIQLDLFGGRPLRAKTKERLSEALEQARQCCGPGSAVLGTQIEIPRRERMLAALAHGVP